MSDFVFVTPHAQQRFNERCWPATHREVADLVRRAIVVEAAGSKSLRRLGDISFVCRRVGRASIRVLTVFPPGSTRGLR